MAGQQNIDHPQTEPSHRNPSSLDPPTVTHGLQTQYSLNPKTCEPWIQWHHSTIADEKHWRYFVLQDYCGPLATSQTLPNQKWYVEQPDQGLYSLSQGSSVSSKNLAPPRYQPWPPLPLPLQIEDFHPGNSRHCQEQKASVAQHRC